MTDQILDPQLFQSTFHDFPSCLAALRFFFSSLEVFCDLNTLPGLHLECPDIFFVIRLVNGFSSYF